MAGFSFRLRFRRSPSETVNFSASRWEWGAEEDSPSIVLCAHKREEAIKDSEIWVLKSDGWPSEAEAHQAAGKCFDALALTLVRLQIGADFGNRAPKSAVTNRGLAMLEATYGHRVLNDVHGLMVYETEPLPRFVSANTNILLGKPQGQFERIFSHALTGDRALTERERLSVELFHTSFFQKSNESRLLLLMMAIEALLEPSPRSSAAASHVESIIAATHESEELSEQERESLLGSLKWLRKKSINKTGRELAKKCLHGRNYMDKEAPSFF
jgi:hypothetical protein